MKARLIFVFAVLALITAQAAGAEVNLGAGVSYEGGNSPISSVMPLNENISSERVLVPVKDPEGFAEFRLVVAGFFI